MAQKQEYLSAQSPSRDRTSFYSEEDHHESQMADKELLYEKSSVEISMTHCIFAGTSEVGKSSLKHFLVHNTPKAANGTTAGTDTLHQSDKDEPEAMPTGMPDVEGRCSDAGKPKEVTISFEQYAVVGVGADSTWKLVTNNIMGNSLHSFVSSRALDEGSQPHGEEKQKHPSLGRQHKLAVAKDDRALQLLDTAYDSFMKEMQKGDGESIELRNASFIRMIDTGGQPSFQDALPLLITAPCTYIQVFNAARDLDKPILMTYHPDQTTVERRKSEETGWEIMLRSFSTMQTKAHKCSKELASFQQEGGKLPQHCIAVVGTFKDMLNKEERYRRSDDISMHLRKLEGKLYHRLMTYNPSNGQPFFLVSTIAIRDRALRRLRNSLGSAALKHEVPVVKSALKHEVPVAKSALKHEVPVAKSALKHEVPVAWLMCEQITQRAQKKFFRVQDLKAFCMKHKLIDAKKADKHFHSLLQRLSLLGFYTFFDLKEFDDESNFVCTDTGVFLKEVSKLLAVQFHHGPAVKEFKQSGIITSDTCKGIFEELGISKDVDPRWFLSALEHVGLMARQTADQSLLSHLIAMVHPEGIQTDPGYFSYFMPSALPEGKTKLPLLSTMAPLCFTFKFKTPNNPLDCTYLPRGIFCRLAVELSRRSWIPCWEESDRTTVKFKANADKLQLYLCEAPEFISLTPVLVEKLEGKEQLEEKLLHKLCKELFDTLHKSVIPSSEDVLGDQIGKTAEIMFGFECDCGHGRVPHLATPASSHAKSLICQASKTRQASKKDQQIWFSPVSGIKLDEVKNEEGKVFIVRESTPTNPSPAVHSPGKMLTPPSPGSPERSSSTDRRKQRGHAVHSASPTSSLSVEDSPRKRIWFARQRKRSSEDKRDHTVPLATASSLSPVELMHIQHPPESPEHGPDEKSVSSEKAIDILSQEVNDLEPLTKCVSSDMGNKGKLLLEGVGLDTHAIRASFTEGRKEEPVMTGLRKWTEGKGLQPHTWKVLLEAMEYAAIGQQFTDDLMKQLQLDRPKEDEGKEQVTPTRSPAKVRLLRYSRSDSLDRETV